MTQPPVYRAGWIDETGRQVPPPPTPAPFRNNGLAITSMFLALGGIFTCGITSPIAVAFGIHALIQIGRGGSEGRLYAIVGIAVGALVLLFWLAVLFAMLGGAQ